MGNFNDTKEKLVELIRQNKFAVLSGIGLFLMVVVGGLVWWFFGNNNESNLQPESIASVESQTQQVLRVCSNADNPEFCRSQQLSGLANQSGALEPCFELAGNERVDCVWGVARDRVNEDFCNALENEVYRNQCKDEVLFMRAVNNEQASYCEGISDQEMRGACMSRIAGPVTLENCEDRGYDEAYCDDVTLRDQALERRDFSICQEINGKEMREACIDELAGSDFDNDGLLGAEERGYGSSDTSTDTDEDGLSDRVEIEVYGTDPSNPDTDGDGFSDGEEVASGYNPAGSGQL